MPSPWDTLFELSLTLPTPAVMQLLESHLDTFEKLEVARALHAAGAASVALVAFGRLLGLGAADTRQVVESVCRSGLAEWSAPDAVRLVQAFEHDAVAVLMQQYADDRVVIATALSAIAMHRIRGMASTFAATVRKGAGSSGRDGH